MRLYLLAYTKRGNHFPTGNGRILGGKRMAGTLYEVGEGLGNEEFDRGDVQVTVSPS